MNQLPFQTHSLTSYEAALAMAGSSTSLKAKVMEWLIVHGPATDKQIQEGLKMGGSTQRPRRIELQKEGLVVEAGQVKQGNGRRATRWGVAV
tara:strand:+ start:1097 stop:1372 length:276 start_codon:yes stop_codon:yes gene_type:complete